MPALEPILHPIIQGGAIFGGGTALIKLFEFIVRISCETLPHACRDLCVEFQGKTILLDFFAFRLVIWPIDLLALCGAVPGRIATRTFLGTGLITALVLAEVDVGHVWRFLDLCNGIIFLDDPRVEKWLYNLFKWKRLAANTNHNLLGIASNEVNHVSAADLVVIHGRRLSEQVLHGFFCWKAVKILWIGIGRNQKIGANDLDHRLNLFLGKRAMNVHLKDGHADTQEGSEEFDGE